MWTLDTVVKYFKSILKEMDKRYQQRFQAQVEEVGKALAELERRLIEMNNFRDAMKNQQATFETKTEAELKFANLGSQIKGLSEQIRLLTESNLSNAGKRAGAVSVWTVGVAILGAVALALGVWANLHK